MDSTVTLLTNAEGNRIGDGLRELLEKHEEIIMAVAYLKSSGYDQIKDLLEIKRCRVLAGLDFALTDPEVLEDILTCKSIQCRVFRSDIADSSYHPKVYAGYSGNQASIILGSSNLSDGAMTSNIEVNVMITGNKTDETISSVTAYLESLWNGKYCVGLDKDLIQRYRPVFDARRAADSKLRRGRRKTTEEKGEAETESGESIWNEVSRDTPQHWLCVTSPSNWDVCRANGLWGAKEKGKFQGEELLNTKPGDLLLIHANAPVSGEVALARVKSRPFWGTSRIWSPPGDRSVFPQRISIDILEEFTDPIRTSVWLRELVSSGGRITSVSGATIPQSLLQGKAMIPLTKAEFDFINGRIRRSS